AGQEFDYGRRIMEPILFSELLKVGGLEVEAVPRSDLARWTRSAREASGERLRTASDAVLYLSLTDFRPYPPLAVGISAKLVNITATNSSTSVDVVVDLSSPDTRKAVKAYV